MGSAESKASIVWLYLGFCPGYRDAERLLAERSAMLTYEAVLNWWRLHNPAPRGRLSILCSEADLEPHCYREFGCLGSAVQPHAEPKPPDDDTGELCTQANLE
jgi:hypothetical protein